MKRAALALALLLLLQQGCSQASPPANGDVVLFDATPLDTVTSTSGALRMSIYDSNAGIVRGANAFKLHIADSSNGAVEGLALTITPWMPAHAHGTSSVPVVQALGGGDYVVREVNLFMPGRWQLRVDVAGMNESLAPALDVP